jgi:intraflagellar transport protein 57
MADGDDGERVLEEDPTSPFVQMLDIIDKLKLLDYEASFCRKQTANALTQPLTRAYFAMKRQNANEQLFYFTSLCAFLLTESGNEMAPPGQFDDPNATCAAIIDNINEAGITTDIAPHRLVPGFGEPVCSVLNALCNFALEVAQFRFGPPQLLATQANQEEDLDVEDDEDGDDIEDEAIIDDDEHETQLEDEDELVDRDTAMIESSVDPAEWRLEVERVSRLFTMPKAVGKDWRSHFDRIKQHQKKIDGQMDTITEQLDKMTRDITDTLTQIETREKLLNEEITDIRDDYKGAKLELTEVSEKCTEASKTVNALTIELQNLKDESDDVKRRAQKAGEQMTDTSGLVKLKKAMSKVQKEIAGMDVRVGVMQSTLLQQRLTQQNLERIARSK